MTTLLKLLFITLSAAGVALLVMGLGNMIQGWWIKWRLSPFLQSRQEDVAPKPIDIRNEKRQLSVVVDMLSRLSLPQSGWHDSAMQLRFIRAGFRYGNAPRIYFAIKTGFVLVSLIMGFLLMPLVAPKAPWSQWLIVMLLMAITANLSLIHI